VLCSASLVWDTTQYPYRAVGQVTSWWDMNHNGRMDSGEVFSATAAMIGRTAALTSGHVVYNPSRGGFATSVSMTPGLDGTYRPFGTFQARSWVVSSAYKKSGAAAWDVAVLDFSSRVGTSTDWFGWKAYTTSFLRKAVVNNIGYPAETRSGNEQYSSHGYPVAVDSGTVSYATSDVPVEHGSSGSPVYVYLPSTGRRYIVAVHSRRNLAGDVGMGTRLNSLEAAFIDAAEHNTGRGGRTGPFTVSRISSPSIPFFLDGTRLRRRPSARHEAPRAAAASNEARDRVFMDLAADGGPPPVRAVPRGAFRGGGG
jgi:V8-like Glu-specific endopeptidase